MTCPPGMPQALVGDVLHLVCQRVVPDGRRAEQYICLPWLVYLLIVLLLQALSKVVQGVKVMTPLSPPSTPTPLAPGSPYDARPGI